MADSLGGSDPASAKLPGSPVSPAAREVAVSRLSDAFANDLITLDELEHRIAATYAVTDLAELATLTSDLPRAPGRGLESGLSVAATLAPQRLSAVFSNLQRTGIVDVPRRIEFRIFAGNIELDLSQAHFAPGVTDFVIRSLMGNMEIILPPDVLVENYAETFMSSFENQGAGGDAARAGASIVRITGRAILSSVEVGV